MKNLSWRVYVVPAVILAALIYLLPTIDMVINGKEKPTLWPKKQINLGLDLQGGMHLVLEVQAEKALERRMERLGEEMRSQMRKEKIHHKGIGKQPNLKLAVKIPQDNVDAFNAFLSKDYNNLKVETATEEGITTFTLSMPESEVAELKKMAVDQSLETIRNRIDQFGVSEPDIRHQGKQQILIQLPGIKDTKRAKDLIGRTAQLEFRLVDEEHDVNAALKGEIPPGSEILYQSEVNAQTNQIQKKPFLIKKHVALTGDDLTDARVQIDSRYNQPYVSLNFDQKGARQFERVTGENIDKRLAIVLDNTVYSTPVIRSKIAGGNAMIEGSFSMEEARDLAIVLRAGALPAPVKILEERTVGPSLGRDSIHQGLISTLIGGLAVILFMAVYYRSAGIIADIALFMNIVLILGGLAALQATLTLPGIAGIILTIGMAVDANVLIFERIREELRLGKTYRAAVSAGFDRAMITIVDSNLTTLIAALVLFQFGTGPVKGFAVTLSLGVISSMFTGLTLSRLIFDFLLINRGLKTISI